MTITPITTSLSSGSNSTTFYLVLLIFIVGLAVIIKLINKFLKKSGNPSGKANFISQNNGFLLTKAEFDFYKIILLALKDEKVIIFAKVRLGDLVKVLGNGSVWSYGHNESNRKHIDFVICEEENAKVLFALELDDRSHEDESRQKGDEFKNEVLKEAGVPLIRFNVQREYNANSIKETLEKFLNDNYSNSI